MDKLKPSNEIFFKAGLALIILYFLYFSGVVVNLYNIFHEYSDFTLGVYNLYYNVHYPQIVHGLQLLEFDQHIAPDSIFLTFAYSIFQSPITLLVIQLAFMCATAYVILRMTSEFTGDNFMAFALCMAFLVNAGTLGLIIYDSHIEFLISLFYMLTLYFYMKSQLRGFAISLLLLLGSMDVAPLMALTLGIGLVFYEFFYNKKKDLTKTNVNFAYLLIALSLIAMLLYSVATSSLEGSYGTAYANLPPTFKINNGAQNMIGPGFSALVQNPIGKIIQNLNAFALGYRAYLIYAILLVAFGFGLMLFIDPVIAIIFALPWLSGIFLLGETNFVLPLSESFGFVIGPAAAAAILGVLIYRKRKMQLSKRIVGFGIDVDRIVRSAAIVLPLLFSVVAPLIYLFVFSSANQYHSVNLHSIVQILSFSSNSSQIAAYSQLNSVLSQVPQNASVMAQYYDTAHLANRQYLESIANYTYYFHPQYVVIDFNANISNGMCIFDNCTKLNDFVGSGNYSIYIRNGSAVLYKAN